MNNEFFYRECLCVFVFVCVCPMYAHTIIILKKKLICSFSSVRFVDDFQERETKNTPERKKREKINRRNFS
jgi:hypothetical protein